MIRRIGALFLATTFLLILTGCWDYRSLDTLDIVSGLAIDKDLETGIYTVTFEIIDTQSFGKNKDVVTKYVDADGETIFNAVRNAKRRLINKLFGGNTQTLIISKQIAETEGVDVILEELQRDRETRETLSVIISQQETAREILFTDGLDSKIIAYELYDMIAEDNAVTASTTNISLYQAYNAIHGTGNALVLPAIRSIKNNEQTVAESNGIAIFKEDLLIGFESPENTLFYLFLMDKVDGGVISFPVNDADKPISLEIKESRTKVNVVLEDNTPVIQAKVKMGLNITEMKNQIEISDLFQRGELEDLINQFVEGRIRQYFSYIQEEIGIDIFGFGRNIYQQEPDVWREIENEWDALFKNARLEIKVETDILTSGVIKDY